MDYQHRLESVSLVLTLRKLMNDHRRYQYDRSVRTRQKQRRRLQQGGFSNTTLRPILTF